MISNSFASCLLRVSKAPKLTILLPMLYIVYFLVITKRRIGKSMSTIRDAINNCDIVALPAEHAELLLKLLPTKDEVADH